MTRLAIFFWISFLLPAIFSNPVLGMVDQSQTTGATTGFSPVDSANIGGQSFVPMANNVSGARVAIAGNQTSPITFELYDTIGVGAMPLATAVSPAGYIGPDWAEATFSSPVPVTTRQHVLPGVFWNIDRFSVGVLRRFDRESVPWRERVRKSQLHEPIRFSEL